LNERNSRQGEGYDLYDSVDDMAFNAVGGAEVYYVVGTNQNAAIAGAWSSETGLYQVSLLTANVAIGANAIPVVNGALFAAGQTIRIIDAAGHMDNVILAVVGNVLTVGPLAYAFTVANGAAVYSAKPENAQNTQIIATQDCFIRWRSKELIGRQTLQLVGLGGGLPAGLPVQIPIQANTFYSFPDKWVIINIVGQGAVAGTITIKTSG